jgi:hypothetical protein
VRTENAAHRVAVEWDTRHGVATGVYVPMRVSGSRLTTLLGGRVVPGLHRLARFDLGGRDGRYEVAIESGHGLSVDVVATESDHVTSAVFDDLDTASHFFESAPIGWSPDHRGRLEGMRMTVSWWRVRPLRIESMASSWFDDPTRFPPGSLQLDCGLLMDGLTARFEAVGPAPQVAGAGSTSSPTSSAGGAARCIS